MRAPPSRSSITEGCQPGKKAPLKEEQNPLAGKPGLGQVSLYVLKRPALSAKRPCNPFTSSCNPKLSHGHLKGPNARAYSPHKLPAPTWWGLAVFHDAATRPQHRVVCNTGASRVMDAAGPLTSPEPPQPPAVPHSSSLTTPTASRVGVAGIHRATTCQPAHALTAHTPTQTTVATHAPGHTNSVGTCMRRTSARVTVRMNRPGLVSARIKLHVRGEVGKSTNRLMVTPTHLQRGNTAAQHSTVQCQCQPRGSYLLRAHSLLGQLSSGKKCL